MRPLLAGDVDHALWAVLDRPESEWDAFARYLIDAADTADAHCRSRGEPHPDFGTGSLMSVAMRHKRDVGATVYTARYCRALKVVLDVLIETNKTRDA